jgi:cytochrome oxidase Cu insertion factor (SCO1/SenC/PrrC family)
MLRTLSIAAGFGLTALAAVAAVVGAQTPQPETGLKVGDMAPPFALQGSDGKIHKLADYKGKTVVLAWFVKAFTGG